MPADVRTDARDIAASIDHTLLKPESTYSDIDKLCDEARKYGEHCTVAVMWSFVSLPQSPRSPAEEERFRLGLPLLHRAFAHPYTLVLLVGPTSACTADTTKTHVSRTGW